MEQLLELVTPVSIASSALLGAMIGALYGYTLAPRSAPMYPGQLWASGLAFIVCIGIFSSATGLATTPWYSVGRGVLWTVLCSSIPAGRWLRYRFEEWRVSRRRRA